MEWSIYKYEILRLFVRYSLLTAI